MCVIVIYYYCCTYIDAYSRFENTRRLSVAETCLERTMTETTLHTECIYAVRTHAHIHIPVLPDLCNFKRFAVRLTYLKTREKTRSRFLFLFLLEKDFSRTFIYGRCALFFIEFSFVTHTHIHVCMHELVQVNFSSTKIVFFF